MMSSNNLLGANLRRTLLLSPGQQQEAQPRTPQAAEDLQAMEMGANDQAKTDQAFMKVSFERYISQIVSSAEMEAHQERIKKITEVAHNLHKDEWMFTPVEKLLGNYSQ